MSAVAEAEALAGNRNWKASLSLTFEKGPSRTIVRRSHSGPLTVQRPLYPESSVAHVYMLHPPGGVVGGDELSMDVKARSGAAGLVTTPGATKFYRSNGLVSSVKQLLAVQGGSLEWFPQENIFFNACQVEIATKVALCADSALALWDIQCFGRPAGDEAFVTGRVINKLTVLVDDVPVVIDRLRVDEHFSVSRATLLRGNTVCGVLLLNRMSSDSVELARKTLDGLPEFYTSIVDAMLIVRYLGDSAQQAKDGFSTVWSQLRHLLNDQSPCVPRIWAT